MNLLRSFVMDDSGEGAIEYGLLAAMISCFVLSALQKVGLNLSTKFKVVTNALS